MKPSLLVQAFILRSREILEDDRRRVGLFPV
jgi:hypothetical protein